MAKKPEVPKKEQGLSLKATIAEVEKKFGKGVVMRIGDSPRKDIPHFSSGITSLDFALGIGGYPRGRIIEVYGPESSGKTTMTLIAIAEIQKLGGNALFIDAEHAFDPKYAELLGVDVNNLYLTQPDCGEDALTIAEDFTRSGTVDIIVIDSVAALTPRSEIQGEMGDSSMGVHARLMSQALRKLTAIVAKSNTTLFFINQLRMKIGVMFGNPETTTGGNALKFYASIRLDVRRTEQLKKGEEVYGSLMKVKVAKNKVAPPFRQIFIELIFGVGIDRWKDIVDLAVEHNVIQKSGSWYSYKEERLGQGSDAVAALFKKDDVFFQSIRKEVMKLLNEKVTTISQNTAIEEAQIFDAESEIPK